MPLDYMSIARTAMSSFRLGINVAGYNVANANTVGFSRRRMHLGTMDALPVRNGLVGMGVDVLGVTRVRDRFVDIATRDGLMQLGAERSRQEVLAGLEPVLGTVEDAALSGALSNLFDAFDTLAVQPDSPAVRADVLARAGELAATFRRADASIVQSQRAADTRLRDAVARTNEILSQLRQMNVDVVEQEATGIEASDLRDNRDALLDELTQLVPARVVEHGNGQVSVYLDGSGDTLLATVSLRPLKLTDDASGFAHVIVDRGGEQVDVTMTLRGGEVGGLLEVREDDLQSYRDTLDALASTVITEINAIHTAGFDLDGNAGLALFQPDPPGAHAASSITVNAALANDPRRIAAAGAPGEVGNNANALALVALRETDLAALGGRSLIGYTADLLAEVGRDVKTSSAAMEAGETVVNALQERRAQISGVSLDEEAADLVRWQQAFQAAARFLQMANEMVDETLDRLAR